MIYAVTDLACRRGPRTVLDGVTFAVAPGDALILRGSNGAGKTTLLRTLAGLAPPARGTVDADAVAYAGHADGLKGQLSVAENLTFWARIFGARDVAPAVETFDLHDLLGRRATDLSAGQRRRAGLARLPLTGRPVWLLDEPTVSLDTASVTLLLGAVRAHLAGGGAAILATHVALDLPGAATLDLARFAPRQGAAAAADPFAEAVE